MKQTLSILAVALSSLSLVAAQPAVTGNCVSGNYTFAQSKLFAVPIGQNVSTLNLNPNQYDFSIDYGSANTVFDAANNAITLKITKGTSAQGDGVRLSTTRYIYYGKFTASFSAAAVPGAVTAFITMSDVHDEIDYEVVGSNTASIQSNIFYRGIAEYDSLLTGRLSAQQLTQATVAIPDTTAFNKYWYPETPSQVQFSVWDGGNSPNSGTSSWAGGPTDLTKDISAKFNWFDVQCYNDKDQLVSEWPVGSKGTVPAVQSQTTAALAATKTTASGILTQVSSGKGTTILNLTPTDTTLSNNGKTSGASGNIKST
ncbi:hypothetical protein HK096_003962, partial [Nowakowskiella sp. JEL0078]